MMKYPRADGDGRTSGLRAERREVSNSGGLGVDKVA